MTPAAHFELMPVSLSVPQPELPPALLPHQWGAPGRPEPRVPHSRPGAAGALQWRRDGGGAAAERPLRRRGVAAAAGAAAGPEAGFHGRDRRPAELRRRQVVREHVQGWFFTVFQFLLELTFVGNVLSSCIGDVAHGSESMPSARRRTYACAAPRQPTPRITSFFVELRRRGSFTRATSRCRQWKPPRTATASWSSWASVPVRGCSSQTPALRGSRGLGTRSSTPSSPNRAAEWPPLCHSALLFCSRCMRLHTPPHYLPNRLN